MGGRKRTYTEAMLAAATAALEDADRDGVSRPEPDARARAVPVRARRSARRAAASPAAAATAAAVAAPGATSGSCGTAGTADSDPGGSRRRSTRLDAARLDTAHLGTARSGHDGGGGGRGDVGRDDVVCGDVVRGDGGRNEVGRGPGGRGDRHEDDRAAVGRRRVTFDGVHGDDVDGDGGIAGRGALPLPQPTSTTAGVAESSAEYASSRSAMMARSAVDESSGTSAADNGFFGDEIRPLRRAASCRGAHAGDVIGQQSQERDERIKRIERAEQMEVDAALAASRAVAATEAAARMAESMEVDAEARGYMDVGELMVDDVASAPAPAAAAEPGREAPMDLDAAVELPRAQLQAWLARTRASRERASRVHSPTGGGASESPPVDDAVESLPPANEAGRSPYQEWLAARRVAGGGAAAGRDEGSLRGRSRGRNGRGGAIRSGAGHGAAVEDDGASGRGRGRSWSHAEKMALCRAWLAVSRDPIIGTDQTSGEFYAAVVEAYRRGFDLPAGWLPRSAAAIVRFMRYTLFKNVQLFAAVYARVHRRNLTGHLSEEDVIRAAEAELDAGDAYEAARANPDHDPEEPEPQGRARGRGFHAADWIPGWRILRSSDKFGGAAAAAAATSTPPPRGRGPTSASARVREHRDSGTGEGAEEEDDDEQEERCGDGGRGPWRAPQWEAIPIGTKRAKATRSVELSMQRDCASMARTLGSLAEAANDRVDQSFYFSRWMRDSEDTRLWVAAESQRRMLRAKQRLLGAEAAEARRARVNNVNNRAVASAEPRRVAHPNNCSEDSNAASAARRRYMPGRVASPSQTPSATMASARASAAAASTRATTGSSLRAPMPMLPPPVPQAPAPAPPPPPPLPPPPSPQPALPPTLSTGRARPAAGATPAGPLLRVPRPPRPLEHVVVLPPLVSPAATPVICISSGTSSVVEPRPGVAAVINISSDDSAGRGARMPVASRPEMDGHVAADADGDAREAAKRIVDAKRGANAQATKLRNYLCSGPLTSGPGGAAIKGRVPPSRCRGPADEDYDRDVPDIDDELSGLALGDAGQEDDGTGAF